MTPFIRGDKDSSGKWGISGGPEDQVERDTCFGLALEVNWLRFDGRWQYNRENTDVVIAWANLILAQRNLARIR